MKNFLTIRSQKIIAITLLIKYIQSSLKNQKNDLHWNTFNKMHWNTFNKISVFNLISVSYLISNKYISKQLLICHLKFDMVYLRI